MTAPTGPALDLAAEWRRLQEANVGDDRAVIRGLAADHYYSMLIAAGGETLSDQRKHDLMFVAQGLAKAATS